MVTFCTRLCFVDNSTFDRKLAKAVMGGLEACSDVAECADMRGHSRSEPFEAVAAFQH